MSPRIGLFAISLALIGYVTPSSFGQLFERSVSVAALPQPIQEGAPDQVQPSLVQPAEVAAPASSATTAEEKSAETALAACIAALNEKDTASCAGLIVADALGVCFGDRRDGRQGQVEWSIRQPVAAG